MITPNFNLLQSNLIEIYASLKDSEESQDLPLEPFLDDRVFYKKTPLGFGAVWINSALNSLPSRVTDSLPKIPFLLHVILINQFSSAVQHAYHLRTLQIIHSCKMVKESLGIRINKPWDRLKSAFKKYEGDHPLIINYATYSGFDKKSPLPLWKQRVIREQTLLFQSSTFTFWRIFFDVRYGSLKNRFMQCIEVSSDTVLKNRTLFSVLRQEFYRVEIEGILEKPIPIIPLAKLLNQKDLLQTEITELRAWVTDLKLKEKEISLISLENILRYSAQILEPFVQRDDLLELLILLFDLETTILSRDDPLHLDWRDRLKPGDQIECNGMSFELDAQLSPEKLGRDTYKVFAIKNNNKWVVKIANNSFRLKIDSASFSNPIIHWGIPPERLITDIGADSNQKSVSGLDREGKVAIVERMEISLDNFRWQSQTIQLKEVEEIRALVLANSIYCQMGWGNSATPFNLTHLCWTSDHHLRSIRVLHKEKSNYDKWEKICFDISHGNFFVLNYLMHVSKLNAHPIAVFYREMVSCTLKTGQTSFLSTRRPERIWNETYEATLERLCSEAKLIRETCRYEVVKELRKWNAYRVEQEKEIEKLVYETLETCYVNHPLSGRISEDLINQVIDGIVHKKNVHFPIESAQYYQNQFNKLTKLNGVEASSSQSLFGHILNFLNLESLFK